MPYIGKGGNNGFGIRERYRYSASSNQTNFSGTDLDGKTLQIDSGSLVDVYLNGVLLDTADYNTNTANTITLTSGASASDEVMIIVYDVFSLSDAMPKTGGTFTGATTFSGAFTSKGIDDNADAVSLTIDTSENVTLNSGNLVIGTSGKGIDFSATANSGVTGTGNQAELLADYEKGTWTPNDVSGASITYAQKQGSYIKIGDQVTAWGYIQAPSSVTHTGAIQINGLPFTTAAAGTAQSGTSARGGSMISFQNTGEDFMTVITIRDSQQIEFFNKNGNNLANNILNGSKTIMFAVTYHTGIA